MELKEKLARLAGRMLRPFHAGDKKLAGAKQHGDGTILVESDAFPKNGTIPTVLAGDSGRAPSLKWSNLPEGTQELALVVEDPDAPLPQPFVHWLVYGLPPSTSELDGERLPLGAAEGRTSNKRHGWFGPEPPPGHGLHHYHFQLFALDRPLGLTGTVDRDHLLSAMKGHVLASGDLVGTFERR